MRMIEYGNFEMKEEPLLGESPRSERMFYYVRIDVRGQDCIHAFALSAKGGPVARIGFFVTNRELQGVESD